VSAETHLEVYRRYTGKLEEGGWSAWPLFTTGLRTALKQRKALSILYLPALIVTVILCFVVYIKFTAEGLMQDEPMEGMDFQEQMLQALVRAQAEQLLGVVNLILYFSKGMGVFALLAVAWLSSGLFCEDKKAGAHQLYFARPITRLDYFLGKFMTAAFFGLWAMLVPLLSVCIAASIASPEWSFLEKEWDVFFRVIGFSLLWTCVISTLVLLASSLAGRKSFAFLGVFGFVMMAVPVSAILGEFVQERFFALALIIDLEVLSSHFFGKPSEVQGVTATTAWIAVGGFMALALAVIAARLKRLEIVS
jgi:ABC-type transport system involved in multi-copper enzyme maturation permease subunit